jgi:hypothetical protein
MKSDFWLLDSSRMSDMAMTMKYEPTTCSENPGHRSARQTFGDLWVELPSREFTDFEWTWTHDILVSPHVIEILKENDVTGFETRPLRKATYAQRSQREPPPLLELAVTGWGGAGASAGVEVIDFCPVCRRREYRIAEPSRLIDPSAWDGSDFFIVWPFPRFRYVSDRLARIIRRNRLSGVKLIPAAEPSAQPRSGGASPGTLDMWMPEDRAREIGEKFDVL